MTITAAQVKLLASNNKVVVTTPLVVNAIKSSSGSRSQLVVMFLDLIENYNENKTTPSLTVVQGKQKILQNLILSYSNFKSYSFLTITQMQHLKKKSKLY